MTLFELAAVLTLDKSKYDEGINNAEEQGKSFGSKLSGAAKVAAGAIAAVGVATVAITKSFISATGEVASYGDNIDKMSQKMGVSAQAYQEWDFILQHSGSSMEAMKASMKTLATAAETNNEAFKQLGITEKELASMSQEELFARVIQELQGVEDTTKRTYLAGQLLGRGATELGALLNMTAEETAAMRQQVHDLGGVMSDEAVKAAAAYQDSLQNMQTAITGLKNRIIGDFLPSVTSMMDGLAAIFSGNGETGLGLLSKGVEDFVQKLSDAATQILPIAGELVLTLAEAIIQNLPTLLETAVQVVLTLAQGIIEQLPTILEAALQIIQSLLTGLTQAIPTLIPVAVDIVMTLVENLINALPSILSAGLELVMALAEGIIAAIPRLVAKLPQIITAIVNFLMNSISKIADTGMKLLSALVKALPSIIQTIVAVLPQIITAIINYYMSAIPLIVETGIKLLVSLIKALPTIITTIVGAIPQIINGIVGALSNNIPAIIQAGFQLFVAIIENLPGIIAAIVSAVPQIVSGIVSAFASMISSMWNVGKSLVQGIWQGISNSVSWIKDKITGWVGNVLGFMKGLFGIHSPSTVMRDQVGLMLGRGVAEGIVDSIGDVESASDKLLGAIPDLEGRDFSLNVKRNMADSYSGSMEVFTRRMEEIIAQFQQTIILQMDEREFGRAVRGYA